MLKKPWIRCLLALTAISATQAFPGLVNAQNLKSTNGIANGIKVGETRSQGIIRSQKNAIASVFAYKNANQNSATVYLRGIPIVSVVSSQDSDRHPNENQNNIKLPSAQPLSSIDRALNLAALLNSLSLSGFDPNQITTESLAGETWIKLGDRGNIRLSSSLVFANSTGNPQQDAIAATALIRRLMGATNTVAALPALPAVPKQVASIKALPVTQRIRIRAVFGMASWYGAEFHGRPSASGEVFNKFDLTAAHPSLPFGTAVKVTNVNNGKSVVVRVNDRGPFHGGRVLDVSKAAASALGFLASGVAPVRLEVVSLPRQRV